MPSYRLAVSFAALALFAAACDSKPSAALAPSSSALTAAEKPTAAARSFEITSAGSVVSFVMNAPVEKIHGEGKDAVQGELFIDPTDITKTTGLVKVDLEKLELFQQKRDDEKSDFGERKKNDMQNKHARTWLEISDDAPAAQRAANRWAELKIDKIVTASPSDLTKMSGDERKIAATLEGEFRLHQRKVRKTAKVEATFRFEGDQLSTVSIRTTEPMVVGLEEHDVRPRELFGKLAQKTLSDMGQKVAKEAPIELRLSAKAK